MLLHPLVHLELKFSFEGICSIWISQLQVGGRDFWQWHDDNSTTPFVKQLLIDLRDRVLEFGKKENAELRDSISDARAQMEQHIGEKISFEGNG